MCGAVCGVPVCAVVSMCDVRANTPPQKLLARTIKASGEARRNALLWASIDRCLLIESDLNDHLKIKHTHTHYKYLHDPCVATGQGGKGGPCAVIMFELVPTEGSVGKTAQERTRPNFV